MLQTAGVFVGVVAGAVAAQKTDFPVRHEVTSLPGWVDAKGQPAPLPSRMFTGYLDAGPPPSGIGSMYFHYWLAESENDPSTDPVLFWYNGGPGASSLFGLLQEFGPLKLTENSYDDNYNKTGIPSPILNPFRWTKTHTIVCLDSPPPIGLSFCSEQGPGGSPTSCGPWKDTTVFAANHEAHKAFFSQAFPELKPNPIFFTGESYAGIYVPGFVDAWLSDPVPGANLQGYAVGDGWTGCKVVPGKPIDWCINLDNVGLFNYPNVEPGPYYDIEYFHGHSQFSNKLYRQIQAGCTEEEQRGTVPMSANCASLVALMADEIGLFFPYNLYNSCPVGAMAPPPKGDASASYKHDKHGLNMAGRVRKAALAQFARTRLNSPVKHFSGVSSPCLGSAMSEWLLLPETLAAIGAPANSSFINLDNGHGFNYTSDRAFVGDVYQRAIANGLRVMVYEGDVDACGLQTSNVEDVFVPLFEDVIQLNQTQRWRPWTLDGAQSMAGYVMAWTQAARFVSVRGSGHLVPLNRPEAAQVMLTAFTSNQELPLYKP